MLKNLLFGISLIMTINLTAGVWTEADNADSTVDENNAAAVYITGYKGVKKDIVIPAKLNGKPVTSVGHGAFKDKGITSVVLPETLLEIAPNAFQNNQLKTLIIPGKVRWIRIAAFESNQLTSLIIPGSVYQIDDDAFKSNQLASLILEVGKENRKISGEAFRSNKLTSLTISSVSEFTTRFNTRVEEYTFCDNPITRVVIAHDVSLSETSIDEGDFYKLYYAQCQKSESAGTYVKKDGVWKHQRESFVDGDFVIDIYRAEGFEGVLVDYKGTSKDIVIPDKTNGWEITAIADGVFRKKGLTSVTLPKDLVKIGKEAFAFNNITTLTIPKDVKFIGENAFASNALTSLAFPKNGAFGTRISEGAFSSNQLATAVITLRGGKVAQRAFEGNPLTTIFLIPWDLNMENDAFEKSFHEFLKEAPANRGIFEKKNGAWTWMGMDENGKYWKRED
jgi:hypothetical protein